MKFNVKKNIDSTKRLVLCITDCELKDTILEEDNKIIDLKKPFYSGEEIDEKEAEKLLCKACAIHFVGNKSVEFGVKTNFVENHLTIKGIKYAVSMRF